MIETVLRCVLCSPPRIAMRLFADNGGPSSSDETGLEFVIVDRLRYFSRSRTPYKTTKMILRL